MKPYFDKFGCLNLTGKPKPKNKKNNLEQVLVFADENIIKVLDEDGTFIKIKERDRHVLALCFHNEKLYDAGYDGKILDTFSDEVIAEREYRVHNLCSHNEKLYDSGYYQDIFETFKNIGIAKRNNATFSLCSHEGKLYDAGYDGKIFNTFSNEVIAERGKVIRSLCSHEGKLYDAGYNKKILDTFNNEIFTEKKDGIYLLCSNEGRLFGVCSSEIYDSFTNEVVFKGTNITSMTSCPRQYFVKQGILEART
ncbi:hypothetical protein KY334_06420 [Candidatus Woesearchaeota archaeon]|nr:hypothetical protein [Candidatus Woesearchaeota archaeon]